MYDAPDVDCLVVPLGGGGLAAGCATVGAQRKVDVIGVEPTDANDTYLSWKAGRAVSIETPRTVADGLRHQHPSQLPLAINQDLLCDVLLVPDEKIAEAMQLAFAHLKVIAEPSGACALAALLTSPSRFAQYSHVAVVLSGGNVDWDTFKALIASPQEFAGHTRANAAA